MTLRRRDALLATKRSAEKTLYDFNGDWFFDSDEEYSQWLRKRWAEEEVAAPSGKEDGK